MDRDAFWAQALLRVFSSRKTEVGLEGAHRGANSHVLRWQVDRFEGALGPGDRRRHADRSIDPWQRLIEHIKSCGVTIEERPMTRTGTTAQIESICIRDPDGKLIEVARYL